MGCCRPGSPVLEPTSTTGEAIGLQGNSSSLDARRAAHGASVPGSDHLIASSQPQAVAEAVFELLVQIPH